MSEPKFKKIQRSFASYLRDPSQANDAGGVAASRLQVYRDLFYQNVEGFIANALPICKKLLKSQQWHQLVRDFYANHRCLSPYFLDISREFIDYLWLERNVSDDPAFLKELALYEWLELYVQVSDNELPGYHATGDVLLDRPVVSPWLVLQTFAYCAHKITEEFSSVDPSPTPIYLLFYRDLQSNVKILELNVVSARCLSVLQNELYITGQQMLNKVADELNYDDSSRREFLVFGAETLQYWHSKDILLGTSLS